MDNNDVIIDNNISERNYTFDALKFILAVLVVFRHVPSEYQMNLMPVTTCGVPAFFMVSGWLMYYREVTVKRLLKSSWRIFKILFLSALFYYMVYWFQHGHIHEPSIQGTVFFLFINDVSFAGHLWYLAAYVYVLLALAFIYKHSTPKILYWIVPLLAAVYLAADIYYILADMRHTLTLVYVFRSWLFTGIPFFCFGAFLHLNNGGKAIVKRWIGMLLTVVFVLLAIAEFAIFGFTDHISDVYFTTWPLCFALIALFSSFHIGKNNLFSKWGEKYSLYIYLFHPLIIPMVKNSVPDNIVGAYLQPVIVLFASLVLSSIYVGGKGLVLSIINNNNHNC